MLLFLDLWGLLVFWNRPIRSNYSKQFPQIRINKAYQCFITRKRNKNRNLELMFITSGKIFALAVALLAKQSQQEKVLEVNLAVDENNHIVSISSTVFTSFPTITASLNMTSSIAFRPTSTISAEDIGTNLVDDIWNALESDDLPSLNNIMGKQSISKSPKKNSELKLIISRANKKHLGKQYPNIKQYQESFENSEQRPSNSKKPKRVSAKACNLNLKKKDTDEISSGDHSDLSQQEERRSRPSKKISTCPTKNERIKSTRKRSRKPRKSARKQSCGISPMASIHKQVSIPKFHTLPAKTNANACLIEQTIVIPPQVISVPTLLAPISSTISAIRPSTIRSNISSIIDEKYYNCITNYAGTLTTTLTKLSVLPVPTTQLNVSTATIFAPTTQVVYEVIYTPYTVTTTSTDTMFMIKVTTVCKGSSGCNACELDSNGMVIPAEQLPPGIFATPINEINTNLFDIMGYVGVNPSSFRANLQGFYSTAVHVPLPRTMPIFSQLSSFMSAYPTPTTTTTIATSTSTIVSTTTAASKPRHRHHRKRVFKRKMRRHHRH